MSALVPYEHGEIVRRRGRRGATSVLQFASGGVAADVRVERVDPRNRCSWYALQLAAHASGVRGRLVGVHGGGALDELGSVDVGPGSVGSGRFAVTTPRTGAYQAMYLEIRSDDMLLRIEAPRPPAPVRFRALKGAALVFAAGVAACCAGAAPFALAHAAPPASAASRAAAMPRIAAVPQTTVARNAPARVVSFSARRDDAPGGESVLASYLAVGDRGTVALLNATGTVVSTGAFSRVGTLRLPVPRAYRTLPLTARIVVHRGATKAVSNVVLAPNALAAPQSSSAPNPSAAPAHDAAAKGVTPIDSASSPGAGGIVVIEGRAVAGHPLMLRVTAQTAPILIELEDEGGAVIAERAIAPGATHATVSLPSSDTRATYLLALHYTRNGGEETVIRTVAATPR